MQQQLMQRQIAVPTISVYKKSAVKIINPLCHLCHEGDSLKCELETLFLQKTTQNINLCIKHK